MGHDHDLQPADAHLGDSEFHEPAGLPSLKLQDMPVEKTVGNVRDKPLDFAPGEKMSYSNSGYLVLGYIIERVTGASYEKSSPTTSSRRLG